MPKKTEKKKSGPKIVEKHKGFVEDTPKQKVKEDRYKRSRWRFTVNWNKSIANVDKKTAMEMREKFDSALSTAFAGKNIDKILSRRGVPSRLDMSKIKKVEIETGSEVGPQRKHLHGHGLIFVKHKDTLMMDGDKIKAHLASLLGVPKGSIHLDFSLIRDESEVQRRYIAKTHQQTAKKNKEKDSNRVPRI